MTKIKSFIKQYSLQIYFVLTFTITWGGILGLIGPGGILGTEKITDTVMPFVYLVTLLGPSLAGLLMTALVEGKAGFRMVGSRLRRGRVGFRWYAVALLTAPLLIAMILIVLSQTSPAFLPAITTSENKIGLLLTGIVMGLVVGFFEELGWTVFAVPRLRLRYGVLKSGIILGILWGAWHFPLFLGSMHSSGSFPPALYLFVLLFSFLPAYRVLMLWVYDRTDSLLLIILMHAPLTASQLILIPANISGMQLVTFDLALAACLWIIVGVIFIIKSKKLEK